MSTPIQHDSLDPKSLQYYAPRKLRNSVADPPSIQPLADTNSPAIPQAIVARGTRYDNTTALTEALPEALRQLIAIEYEMRVPRLLRKRPIVILASMAAATVVAVAIVSVDTSSLTAWLDSVRSPKKDSQMSLAERLQSANAAINQVPQRAMAPTLAVKDGSGDSNAGLPLGIDVTNYTPGTTVHLSGLLVGAAINAGTPAGEGGWNIAVDDLSKASVIPPPNYMGPMTVIAELHGSNGQAIVRSPIHYFWKQATADTGKALGYAAPAAKAPAENGTDVSAALRRIDPAESAALLKRAEHLVASGDLPAARLLLHRLAEARNARAAYALGASYDPAVLKTLGSISAAPNPALARTWYQRSIDWGLADASKDLDALASADK